MRTAFLIGIFALSLMLPGPSKVDSAKILAVYSFPGKSHFMMHNALIKELIQRGHQVTMFTAFTLGPEKLGSNYTEVLIEPVYDFWKDIKDIFTADNLFELTSMSFFDFLTMLDVIGVTTTEHALKQPKVQELINANETEGVYDLLLVEQFYQDAFLPLAYKYNIPVVSTSTLGHENYMSQMMGIITPWSFVPHGFMPFTDRMNFFERLQNTFYSLYEDYHREFVIFPHMDALVKKYFSHLPMKIPKVSDMEKNISVLLLNNHAPLLTSRPVADGMVPVGGMHIYPPKPLPRDIQTFLDGAEHGAIYFSLGSNVQSKDMPTEKLNMFLEVFAGLKQRVLWKFEDERIQNLPSNVMVKKWMPQSDILAHRNVRVFITHGGLLGTQEGVYNAVPLLGMPIYCDQHLNMKKAVNAGYAINFHFQSITQSTLQAALRELLENPTYRSNAQRMSEIFRDRPMNARDTAIYWIEYVVRHKGAPHLRSAGLDLTWYQFYLLDVMAFVAGGVLVIVIALIALLRMLLGRRKLAAKSKQH